MPTFIIATSLSLLPLDWPILTSHSPHWLTHLPASLPSGLHSTYTSVCIQPPYKRPVSCIHAQPGRDTLRWHGPPSSTPARLQPAQCTVPARLHQTHPTPASSAVPVRRPPLRVELATSPHGSLSCLARRPGTTRTSSCGSSQTFTCMYPEIHLSYLMLLEPTYSSTLVTLSSELLLPAWILPCARLHLWYIAHSVNFVFL